MSTLQVLMPPLAHVAGDAAFRGWLARGDRLQALQPGRTAALRRLFRFAGDALPAAALRHHCHSDHAATGAWLCADPAWVRGEATGARLMAWPIGDLAAAEADELAEAVRPLLGAAGGPLAIDGPAAWCVPLPPGVAPATFTEPLEALGADLLACLPAGDAGRAWRRLFSEVQIVLHAHPVNAARVAAGRHPVNALWFWGAGTLPVAVDTGLQVVASVDDVARGLAKLGHAVRVEPLPDAVEAGHRPGDALLDLDIPGHAAGAVAWLPHFQRWLAGGRFGAIELAFPGGECWRLRRVHRLRFWRRR